MTVIQEYDTVLQTSLGQSDQKLTEIASFISNQTYEYYEFMYAVGCKSILN
jgi:hypothetical protein